MTMITIDNTDRASIAAAIEAGLATPESMAKWLYSQDNGYQYAVCEDGVLILVTDTWYADDRNAEIEVIECDSAREAAEEYVATGDWGDEGGSVEVHVWRVGIDAYGDDVEVDADTIIVDIPIEHERLIRRAGGNPDCD